MGGGSTKVTIDGKDQQVSGSVVCTTAGGYVNIASGGAATEAKIIAARELGIPVIMVRRPAPEPGDAVETVEAALDWLASQ